MKDNNNSSVFKECIDFIQQRKRDIIDEDSPFSEGDDGISYDIAEERTFSIPICDVSRKLAFVDGGTASILSAADFSISFFDSGKKIGYRINDEVEKVLTN